MPACSLVSCSFTLVFPFSSCYTRLKRKGHPAGLFRYMPLACSLFIFLFYSSFFFSSLSPADCLRISSFIRLTSSMLWHLSVAVVINHVINCICLSVILVPSILFAPFLPFPCYKYIIDSLSLYIKELSSYSHHFATDPDASERCTSITFWLLLPRQRSFVSLNASIYSPSTRTSIYFMMSKSFTCSQ